MIIKYSLLYQHIFIFSEFLVDSMRTWEVIVNINDYDCCVAKNCVNVFDILYLEQLSNVACFKC